MGSATEIPSGILCRNEKTVRTGIGEIMGGKVLELESERLERLQKEAEAEAKAIGEARGRAMEKNLSWGVSKRRYEELYNTLIGR